MNAYSAYKKSTRVVDDGMLVIAGVVVGLDLLLVSASVVFRPFGISYATFQEFPRLFQSFLTFLVIAGVLRAKGHIGVDFLSSRFKGTTLVIVEMLILCAAAATSVILLAASILTLQGLVDFGEKTVSEIEFPIWYIYTSQVVGFLLLFLASFEMLIERVGLLAVKK